MALFYTDESCAGGSQIMSDPISPSDRYNRYAEDWRYHHKLVWEIPSVSAAIFGGITIASYAYLKLLPQSILLGWEHI
jgi:hypothetical protein